MIAVSSTSSPACPTDMSATVRRTVPGLFIVPTRTVSPSSMLSRLTRPSMGESRVTLLRLWRARRSAATSCSAPSPLHLGLGPVEDFLRDQLVPVQAREPFEVLLGEVQVGARGLDRDPGAL